MSWIPDPLHPAVVHFPIVLIVLGTVAALVAVFRRGGHLPRFAALLLVLGALGAWVALETGEDDGGLLEKGGPQLESLVDAHILWAKWTLAATIVAAVLGVGSALAGRWPRIARAAAVATAIGALLLATRIFRGAALLSARRLTWREAWGVTYRSGSTMSSNRSHCL